MENNEQQDDILKELNIMVQLGSHPNVVRLLGCCTENSKSLLEETNLFINIILF